MARMQMVAFEYLIFGRFFAKIPEIGQSNGGKSDVRCAGGVCRGGAVTAVGAGEGTGSADGWVCAMGAGAWAGTAGISLFGTVFSTSILRLCISCRMGMLRSTTGLTSSSADLVMAM